jgi:gamma-glutamylcyclotransferase (GGCT)/AIG2-like uncharacterized protein YtfP
MKVFVYGTLQRGCHNHHLLERATFLGKAVTVRKFGMTDVGFPFMLADQAVAPVMGELFDIGDNAACLARLDRLESEGRMYDRVQGMVECHGQRHLASFYVKRGEAAGRVVPINARGLLEWEGRIMRHDDATIRHLRGTHGLAAEIARECGVSRAAVYQWQQVPARHAIRVARLLNVDVRRVRPDIFNPPAG